MTTQTAGDKSGDESEDKSITGPSSAQETGMEINYIQSIKCPSVDWRQVHLQHSLGKETRLRSELKWANSQCTCAWTFQIRLVRANKAHLCTEDPYILRLPGFGAGFEAFNFFKYWVWFPKSLKEQPICSHSVLQTCTLIISMINVARILMINIIFVTDGTSLITIQTSISGFILMN